MKKTYQHLQLVERALIQAMIEHGYKAAHDEALTMQDVAKLARRVRRHK